MKTKIFATIISVVSLMTVSCSMSHNIDEYTSDEVTIFPDYVDVTVPPNIAPLDFSVTDSMEAESMFAVLEGADGSTVTVDAEDGFFDIPVEAWHSMLDRSKGKSIRVTVVANRDGRGCAYKPFEVNVAADSIDEWIAYRLIEPGYSLWNKLGIYQRNISNFEQRAIFENRLSGNNCINCHSFCNRNPEKMLFHLRAANAGTVIVDGNDIEMLDTKTDSTLSALVYPSWHPSGRYVAFSVNRTTQCFHPTNRIEVYDMASDVVVYDVEAHTILSTPLTARSDSFETFPTFSADGTTLYFCSADARQVPDSISSLRYSLCSIGFIPEQGRFDENVDTIIDAVGRDCSISFPRVSPDGRWLVCTVSGYGTFPIWHQDAELLIVDLVGGESRRMDAANSTSVESYHSWSSNSRWMVYNSRRIDGLYSRPFFTYIDEEGVAHKPFVLPQNEKNFYKAFRKSFNIPEMISGPVPNNAVEIGNRARSPKRTKLAFERR